MFTGYGSSNFLTRAAQRAKELDDEFNTSGGYMLTGEDRLKQVSDPQKTLAKVTKGEYVDFRKNFGQFERDVVNEAMTDTSLIEDAAQMTPRQFGLAADVQRRNMDRYGGDVTSAQQAQGNRNLITGGILGTSNALNQSAIKQRDLNTDRFYNLIDIGQGVFNSASGSMGQAAKMAADRKAAENAASEQRKAQRTSVAATAAMAFIAFSDVRLKENIKQIDFNPEGFGYYTWDWSKEAIELGCDSHPTTGVLAQEVQKIRPEAVFPNKDTGYLMVNYSLLS
jgi:hypothetical protein